MNTKKSRSVIGKILFSRTVVIVVLLVIQVLVFLAGYYWLQKYTTVLYWAFALLGLLVILYIINSDESQGFKLAWAIPICCLPVFGSLFYIFVKINPGYWGLKKQVSAQMEHTAPYLETSEFVKKRIKRDFPEVYHLSVYLRNAEHYPAYQGTKTQYYSLGQEAFEAMKEELEQAESFIFLEYFIVEEGVMWNAIREILTRKVQEGVEVRFMYDGMCSLVLVPYDYPRQMEKLGIKCKAFSQVKPFLSTDQNFRDHRKIMVIDGRVAFTGGINLADEYINVRSKYGHWKDVALKVQGPAVKTFTALFLQNWNLAEREQENLDPYLKNCVYEVEDDGIIIPYGDGPTNDLDIAENVYLDMLHRAKKYVHIMTPYFVVGDEFVKAMQFAARRGVEVKLLLPHISDSFVTHAMARTYYPMLLKTGVKIYEYTPGFVHAKVFVSDDEAAVVGTINLDYRSLYHHFECGAYLYRQSSIIQIEQDFQFTLAKCQRVDMEFYKNLSVFQRFVGRLMRLAGPLV